MHYRIVRTDRRQRLASIDPDLDTNQVARWRRNFGDVTPVRGVAAVTMLYQLGVVQRR
ncbi:MAG: hypothetical protein HKL86_02615 [Acidimicrobiaceae bacterium]|nr:hypothetical protein [Acidimicrobiaceae bacterium]